MLSSKLIVSALSRKSVGAAELIVSSEPATTSPSMACAEPRNIAVASNAVTGNMVTTQTITSKAMAAMASKVSATKTVTAKAVTSKTVETAASMEAASMEAVESSTAYVEAAATSVETAATPVEAATTSVAPTSPAASAKRRCIGRNPQHAQRKARRENSDGPFPHGVRPIKRPSVAISDGRSVPKKRSRSKCGSELGADGDVAIKLLGMVCLSATATKDAGALFAAIILRR
jgi:hypothetical protein